jgi:hypothetical protein
MNTCLYAYVCVLRVHACTRTRVPVTSCAHPPHAHAHAYVFCGTPSLTHPQLRVASLDDGAADHASADTDVLYGAGASNGGVRVVLPNITDPIATYAAARGLTASQVQRACPARLLRKGGGRVVGGLRGFAARGENVCVLVGAHVANERALALFPLRCR